MATPLAQDCQSDIQEQGSPQEQPEIGVLKTAPPKGRGGFECEFVERPPDVLQTDCPVCQLIVREPNQVACCGYSFCRACIDRVVASKKPCPTCNKAEFSVFPDKRLQGSLYQFRVRCEHQQEGCEWSGELEQLDKHLNENPGLGNQLDESALVICDFHYAGCQVRLPRRDILSHLNESLSSHMALLGAHSQRMAEKVMEKDEEIRRLTNEFEGLKQELRSDNEALKQEVARLSSKQEKLLSYMYVPTFPIDIIMTDFEKYKRDDDIWYSDPFYTHPRPHGYKMCLEVHANGCGRRGFHVSVFVCLMRGEFDDHLRWPLRAHVTIRLLNQLEDREYYENTIRFSTTSDPKRVARVTDKDRALGWGVYRFIPHNELGHNPAKNCQYFRDDCLHFQVTRVFNLDYTASRLCTDATVPPIELTMTYFSQQKQENEEWYSLPFYTHTRGYRMCLRVDANGRSGGQGTHVSVYVHLMRGEFDGYLKWPFRGNITIQLLNQLNDKEHRTETIPFTDKTPDTSASRVTTGERDEPWGCSKFIRHRELKYNSIKNCHYDLDDCLCFRVTQVELAN